jgi:hypothetical protein
MLLSRNPEVRGVQMCMSGGMILFRKGEKERKKEREKEVEMKRESAFLFFFFFLSFLTRPVRWPG